MLQEINFPELANELFHASVGLGLIAGFISSEYRLDTHQKIKKEKLADEANKEMKKQYRSPGETHTAPTNEEERAYKRKKDQDAIKCDADLAKCRSKLRAMSLELNQAQSKLRELQK
jgi:hypothetical protein